MARNKVVQVACAPALYNKISEYRCSNDFASDAEALRALALIGLHSLNSQGSVAQSDKINIPSDREVLESILYHVTKGYGGGVDGAMLDN